MRTNHHRSCTLEDFEPLFELPGINWFSFQMPASREEAEWLEAHGVTNLEPELPGFARTAALARQLDQVISVDTSLVHLAGALGIPTWVVLGQHTDWRWHTEGEQSEWYPNMRLFRAEPGEDWSERIERVKNALNTRLNELGSSS
jgi:ADP-heptose:LPS heptosyltransferase